MSLTSFLSGVNDLSCLVASARYSSPKNFGQVFAIVRHSLREAASWKYWGCSCACTSSRLFPVLCVSSVWVIIVNSEGLEDDVFFVGFGIVIFLLVPLKRLMICLFYLSICGLFRVITLTVCDL